MLFKTLQHLGRPFLLYFETSSSTVRLSILDLNFRKYLGEKESYMTL